MLYCYLNLNLPAEPAQALSLSFLTTGRGSDLCLCLRMTELKVFQATCMSADHKINGGLQRVPQALCEWLSPSWPRSCWWRMLLLSAVPLARSLLRRVTLFLSCEPPPSCPQALPSLPGKWQLFHFASSGGSQHPHHLWSTALAPLSAVPLASVSVGPPHTLSLAAFGGNRPGLDVSWLAE